MNKNRNHNQPIQARSTAGEGDPTEDDIWRAIAGALQSIDRRLDALEKTTGELQQRRVRVIRTYRDSSGNLLAEIDDGERSS